ncbi:hypothetical protein FEM03_24025 [Phragmitibacter flavus]|uniref:Urease accessory protein UreF n=1 Tax=Phragmitibacter flavus TaxID=2576071 RepID=A0A5R8K740_9BACT|nr:urease accessory UreF family protein [Phragmitibacter flavus]TLD68184.1 hypothetical protein FEM03_24025 [Phragmitibacter flavus]
MLLNDHEQWQQNPRKSETTSDLLLWLLQVNDSQFPSGAYAHSMGLEGHMQRGLVKKPEDLETFLERQIVPNLLHFELPYLLRAHQAASANDQTALQALDHELDAWKLGAEMRNASRQLGNRRLAMLLKLDQDEFLQNYAVQQPPCHHLIITAIELRNAPPATAACAFTYQTISGYTSAAMKLIRLGQERCQGILRKTITQVAPDLQTLIDQPTDRIGWFNPTLEISSMRHARAHERLFIS